MKQGYRGIKTIVGCIACLSMLSSAYAQSKEDVKLGLGLHGIELSANKNIYGKFYAEGAVGYGVGYDVFDGFTMTLDYKHLIPYTKGIVKWNYVDLDRKRNFVSLQAKYSFGDSSFYNLNRVLLTEINWGIERHFSNRFLFDLHLGIGHVSDFDVKESQVIPTIGFSLKYRLFEL
ncbi:MULTISPECIES: hypothetical protein [unclassified Myroides]|uniref:hypothetical protein n=1 Tax=unclassified Myroides TaxID=2642485 RepID=UPI003D2F92E7